MIYFSHQVFGPLFTLIFLFTVASVNM